MDLMDEQKDVIIYENNMDEAARDVWLGKSTIVATCQVVGSNDLEISRLVNLILPSIYYFDFFHY